MSMQHYTLWCSAWLYAVKLKTTTEDNSVESVFYSSLVISLMVFFSFFSYLCLQYYTQNKCFWWVYVMYGYKYFSIRYWKETFLSGPNTDSRMDQWADIVIPRAVPLASLQIIVLFSTFSEVFIIVFAQIGPHVVLWSGWYWTAVEQYFGTHPMLLQDSVCCVIICDQSKTVSHSTVWCHSMSHVNWRKSIIWKSTNNSNI